MTQVVFDVHETFKPTRISWAGVRARAREVRVDAPHLPRGDPGHLEHNCCARTDPHLARRSVPSLADNANRRPDPRGRQTNA